MIVRKVTYLEHIGAILKERRLELKFSLEDMSEKTKLSVVQLEAIEAGNIKLFEDDLSYLSYFVRYYSNALGIDYNDIRGQLDDSIMAYTDSISVSKVQQKEAMSERVLHTTKKGSKARKSVDFSSIGLFAITILIVIALIFTVWKVVIPSIQSNKSDELPIVNLPKDEVETPEEEPEAPVVEEPVATKLVVKEVDPLLYEISGWKENEDIKINLEFHNQAWVRFIEDGAYLGAPAEGIYEKDDNALVILKAKKGKELSVNVGYFAGNVFTLNGEAIPVNPEIADSPGAYVINFVLTEGASTE